MNDSSRGVVPGTQLHHRALYALIVGEQPPDCPPGTSVKMQSDGPVLLDHVMRLARRYSCIYTRDNNNNNNNTLEKKGVRADWELLGILEDLRRRNWQYAQELELRKQEVRKLQNKLRIVHSEARKCGMKSLAAGERRSSSSWSRETKKRNNSDRNRKLGCDVIPAASAVQLESSRINNNNDKEDYTHLPVPPMYTGSALASASTITTMTASPAPPYTYSLSVHEEPARLVEDTRDTPKYSSSSSSYSSYSFFASEPQSMNAVVVNNNNNNNNATAATKSIIPHLTLEEDVTGVRSTNETDCDDVIMAPRNKSSSSSSNRKSGAMVPSLPQHLLSGHGPRVMLFCHHCRIFIPPHSVNMAHHLHSEAHKNNSAPHGDPPSTSETTYTQFGKFLQRMPPYISPVTVVSEEQRRREAAAGNMFFEMGLDIVNSVCSFCREVVSTQTYKVHESLSTHRQRVAEAEAGVKP